MLFTDDMVLIYMKSELTCTNYMVSILSRHKNYTDNGSFKDSQ